MCASCVSVNACLCVINDFKGGEGGGGGGKEGGRGGGGRVQKQEAGSSVNYRELSSSVVKGSGNLERAVVLSADPLVYQICLCFRRAPSLSLSVSFMILQFGCELFRNTSYRNTMCVFF